MEWTSEERRKLTKCPVCGYFIYRDILLHHEEIRCLKCDWRIFSQREEDAKIPTKKEIKEDWGG
jgi:DNA-directed RNA polymerase subunit RPC12/RpoP